MRYMTKQGFEVLMVSSDGSERRSVIQAEGCPHYIIPLTRRISPFLDLYCLIVLWRLLLRFRPDIVHSHTPKAGLLGMFAAWLARVPIRIHTIGGLPFETASGFKRPLLHFTEKITCFFASQVWPNSVTLAQIIEGEHLCDPSKIKTIGNGSSNGIDLNRFRKESLSEHEKNRIKKSIGWAPEKEYLLFVGRFVLDKGIVELVTAFSGMEAKRPQLELVLLGEFEDERKTEALPAEIRQFLHDHPRIHLPGWVHAVEYYLAVSDFIVHPSHREGFPNVLLQAAALGCPIICSDIWGNRNLVANEQVGLLFRVGDPNHLQKKIQEGFQAKEEALRKAIFLQQIVFQKYDRKQIHALLEDEYRAALSSNSRS